MHPYRFAYYFMSAMTLGLVLVCLLLLNQDFRIWNVESEISSCYDSLREIRKVKEAQRIHELRTDLHSLPALETETGRNILGF